MEWLLFCLACLVCLQTATVFSCQVETDVVFVLEGSNFITPFEFDATKSFLHSVVQELNLEQTNSRYAVVQYSAYAMNGLPYGLSFTNNATLILSLQQINEPYSGPRVGLKTAREFMEAQGRSTSKKSVVLFSSTMPNYPCSCEGCLLIDNGCSGPSREERRVSAGQGNCLVDPDSYIIPTCKTDSLNCTSCNATVASTGGCMTCGNPIHEYNLMREFGWQVVSFGVYSKLFFSTSYEDVVKSINFDNKFYGANFNDLIFYPAKNLSQMVCMAGPLPSFVILPPPIPIAYLDFFSLFSNESSLIIGPLTGNPPTASVTVNETVTLVSWSDFYDSEIQQNSFQVLIQMDKQSQVIIETNSTNVNDIIGPLQSITINVEQQQLNYETFSGVTLPSYYDVIDPTTKQAIGQVVGTGYNVFNLAASTLVKALNQVSVCVQIVASTSQVRSSDFVQPRFVRKVDTFQKKGTQSVFNFSPYESTEAVVTGVQNQKMCGRVTIRFDPQSQTQLMIYPALMQSITPSASSPLSTASSMSASSMLIVLIFVSLGLL